jgi:hypothetical protein
VVPNQTTGPAQKPGRSTAGPLVRRGEIKQMRGYKWTHSMSAKQCLRKFLQRFRDMRKEGSGETVHSASDSSVLATAVSKWLVPSVSALFIAIGYVAVEAQQNLLGVKLDTMGTAEYIVATGGFLRDICIILPDAAISVFTHAMIDRLELVLMFCLMLACVSVAVVGPVYLSKKICRFTIALVILTGATFIVMDAPLTRIEDAVVNSGTVEGGVPIEIRLSEKAMSDSNGIETFIYKRANSIWNSMVCSRVSGEIQTRQKCLLKIQAEFVSHSIISVLLLTFSLQILRGSTSTWVSIFGLLALFYFLTWPYAYGKLIKSTNFEYGQVMSKSRLVDQEAGQIPENTSIRGIILSAGGKSYKILHLKTSKTDCSGAGSTKIKFIDVAASEVTAIKEIYWQDVLTWRAMNLKDCPPKSEENP